MNNAQYVLNSLLHYELYYIIHTLCIMHGLVNVFVLFCNRYPGVVSCSSSIHHLMNYEHCDWVGKVMESSKVKKKEEEVRMCQRNKAMTNQNNT